MPAVTGRLAAAMALASPLAVPIAVSAATLGNADVRSYVGQPLDVRIDIQASRSEWLDTTCIEARAGDRTLEPLPSSRFRIQDSIETRTLVVRTQDPIVTPYLTLELTVRCGGEAAVVSRTYELSLPQLSAPVVIIQQPGEPARTLSAGNAADKPKSGTTPADAPGTTTSLWTTTGQASLASIAKGVYPRSEKMRAAFIARMREINAEVPLPGDNDPFPAGLKLRLPDLILLANRSPRIDPQLAQSAPPATASPPMQKPEPVAIAAAAPAPSAVQKPAASAPEARLPDAPTKPAQPATPRTATRPASSSSGGFTLRLSGAEMDLSRSRGVSESTRAALRDKQLMLDADDQVAALLALRHTVKQLEGRINEMQLKLSTSTLPTPPPAPVPAPAKPAPAPETAPVRPVPPADVTPAPTAGPATPAPSAPPTPAKPATPQPAPEADTPFWQSPFVIGSTAALILLVAGWFGWRSIRRGRGLPTTLAETTKESERSAIAGRATSDLDGPSSDDLPKSDWDDDALAASSAAYRSSPPSSGLHDVLREAEHRETLRMPAPPALLDAGAASLELDTRPATSVDFMLGDDGGEDKSRRQRYMEERFPELAHHSISVDEPDSIIDAARHHYEEGQLQKAIELLTYAFEERPGQLRFWLALFEIHRLEQRVSDFAELASRFKNVHSGTDAWPKVQHIGRDLDPGQPLYAAALGRLGVPMDADFDPMSENWLNVPMDFTSDVLMIELRHSLMAEHVVLDDELRRPLLEVNA